MGIIGTIFIGLIYGFIALLARYGLWPHYLPWLPWACALAFVGATGYGGGWFVTGLRWVVLALLHLLCIVLAIVLTFSSAAVT